MRKHLIVGAGKWSHAHLTVLSEIGNCTVMLTKPKFTSEESQEFKKSYPIVKHTVDQTDYDTYVKYIDLFYPDYVHIVTPSNTHLDLIKLLGVDLFSTSFRSKILVEKPAVVFNDVHDYLMCLKIKKMKHNIYYNDWMSWTVPQGIIPSKTISFTYNVKNAVAPDSIIREVGSHLASLLLNFYTYNCDIVVDLKHISKTTVVVKLTINGIPCIVNINTNTGIKSFWEVKIDDYQKNSETTPGEELYNMFENFINKRKPRTDWIDSSVLTERLHQLLMLDNQDHWTNMDLGV
jgi:hypothetical protein